MTDHTPPTGQQLDEIEAVVRNAALIGADIDPGTAAILLAEVRRLRALEEAAVHARSALAALCYDLEDPGSNALGALYLLQQATLTTNAPKDDTAAALARHAREVLYRVAAMADPEPPEVSFFGGTFGPQVSAWLQMIADQPKTAEAAAAVPAAVREGA